MKTGHKVIESLRKQLATPLIKRRARICLEDQVAWWQDGGHFNVELYNRLIQERSWI